MKRNFLIFFSIISLVGCSSLGSKPAKYVVDGQCGYDQLPGVEYVLAPEFKIYVTNRFFYDPTKRGFEQRDKESYLSLISQSFKILETDVIAKDDEVLRIKDSYYDPRYGEYIVGGVGYVKDNAFSTKVLTEDCSVFYYRGGFSSRLNELNSHVLRVNGDKLEDQDVLNFYGKESLKVKPMDATIEYDRFEKLVKLKTPHFSNTLIRGSISTKGKSLQSLQVYADVIFSEEWGNISRAIDEDGNTLNVIKIKRDADCSRAIRGTRIGCKLIETVAVDVSEEFLRKNLGGFEIKLSGTKEQIIEISGTMVQGFISGLEKAKETVNSGQFGS